MAKVDKEFYWRMQGMHYAYNIAKENGIEALKEDIKKRGLLKVQFNISNKQIDEMWKELSANMYNNFVATALWSLHCAFGFGKKRLKQFKDMFDYKAQLATDLDWLGEHYSYIYEWAEEIYRKYDIKLDIDRIKENQLALDQKNNYTGRCSLDDVLYCLLENGYEDAARLLDSKIVVRD